jgi:catechol 2,3-dioxygenase-like lactoylglutathione lyase family enzyme
VNSVLQQQQDQIKIMKKISLMMVLLLGAIFSRAQEVTHVDAIGITVKDMRQALDFYTNVLPFEIIDEVEVYGNEYEQLKGLFGIHYKKVRLRLGDEEIELTDYLTSGGRSIPEDSKSNDLWFQHIAIVVSNMDSAYAQLRKYNVVHVSTRPQTLPETIAPAAGVKAFYFRDPDGHNLELIYFPKGKGNPKWQQHDGRFFLGIDHTAIGVSQTERSKKFYGELLGVKYKGESFNFGNEQEHLNNVRGASLHISGNSAVKGPGVEFLEYIKPKTGRPYPEDSKADDLIHWETIMVTNDVNALYQKLKSHNVKFLSSAITSIPSRRYGYQKGFYLRDPDGHAIGVFEK